MKPKYERVADDLRNKIISKKYYVDQLIPSETNLQKNFQSVDIQYDKRLVF